VNVYIATSTRNTDAYHRTRQALEAAGHTITHDWTRDLPDKDPPPGQGFAAALADIRGVAAADVVVALWHPDVYGTLVEIGYAIARSRPVLLVGTWRRSVFWDHPNVINCERIHCGALDLPVLLEHLELDRRATS
jgi:nucleoside 2-deoxyribosyltransferase